MMDIISSEDGEDIKLFRTQTPRAANLLSVQLGDLEYLPDWGIDLAYFLGEDVKFQNESFQAYLIETMARNGLNVSSLDVESFALFEQYGFNLSPEENESGFIAR